jgi:hypothetical protein
MHTTRNIMLEQSISTFNIISSGNVENGTIELEYCPTREMVADALTKPLVKDSHWQLISMMGMETSEQFQSGSVGMLQPSDVA